MTFSRRDFLAKSALASGGLLLANSLHAQMHENHNSHVVLPKKSSSPRSNISARIITPNGSSAPFQFVDGIKTFHLTAEPVVNEFAPGLKAECWGYNGQTPGPTIEVNEGERVRFYITNNLPEITTVHWHGIILPNGMDGVGGLNQPYIEPGETYLYDFIFKHPGTFMYHPHADEMTQMGMGLMGMIIVHPKNNAHAVDRDFAIILSEWKITVGTSKPDPREMSDFNILTLNSAAFPGTEPLVVRTGQKVRIRFGNLSAMHNHPMHLHGYSFKVTATDGGKIPQTAQWSETTVLVPVGSTRDIEFVADAPGDWAMHCHFTHHVMNQMGHKGPNMIGIKTDGINQQVRKLLPNYMTMGQNGMAGMGKMNMPIPENSIPMKGTDGKYGYIDMGGMFTILKVRDNLTSYQDPGWYNIPKGTQAHKVQLPKTLKL